MGLRYGIITGLAVLFLISLSIAPVLTDRVQALDPYNPPLEVGMGYTDANYNDVDKYYYAGIDEQIEMVFDVHISNTSRIENPTVHIFAYLAEYRTSSFDGTPDTPFTIGSSVIASYNKSKEAYSADFRPVTYRELIDGKIGTISANLTFHTAGQWNIIIVYEIRPGEYYCEDDTGTPVHVDQRNVDVSYYLLFGLSFTLIALAILVDVIHRRLIGIDKVTAKKWRTRHRKAMTGVVATFIIILLVLYTFFFVLFPKPSYVQIIGQMDAKMDTSGNVHVAWIKHIEQGYNSPDEMLKDFDNQVIGGSLYYSKIDSQTKETRTILVSSVGQEGFFPPKLVLDSNGYPHIFWMSQRALNLVEINSNRLGMIKRIPCRSIASESFVEVASNDTMYVFGCNGMIVFLPDGTTWTNSTLWAESTYMDPKDNLHIFQVDYDNNGTRSYKHVVLDNTGKLTSIPLNITKDKLLQMYVTDTKMMIRSNGDLFLLTTWREQPTGPWIPFSTEVRILKFAGNSTNSTMIFSAKSPDAHIPYLAMSEYNDRFYGFHSGIESPDEKTFHLIYSKNGTSWETKPTSFRIWNIVKDNGGTIYGIGQQFRYQPMNKDLTKTIVTIPLQWD